MLRFVVGCFFAAMLGSCCTLWLVNSQSPAVTAANAEPGNQPARKPIDVERYFNSNNYSADILETGIDVHF